ncbi:agouti signaling protein 1 [Hoplias malabaricus]|uniref:agouti signaling protein 1 n=1 Tax=Hoplias malabaricus TaxID=27720 RepID=UPI0034631D9E
MNCGSLVFCLGLCLAFWETVECHLLMEELNLTTSTFINQTLSPSVLIVELSNTSKKMKTSEKKPKKNSVSVQVRRPPPPPDCIPLWGNCKNPNNVCCEPCAFCHCRLFRTVCYCRMGYPRC